MVDMIAHKGDVVYIVPDNNNQGCHDFNSYGIKSA